MQKKIGALLICLIGNTLVDARSRRLKGKPPCPIVSHMQEDNAPQKRSFFSKTGRFFSSIAVDAIDLNLKLFSVDSAKIITGLLPVYTMARFIDEDIQCTFHDRTCHKNKNQFPQPCHEVAKAGVSVPMVGLSSLWLFGWNDRLRETGRLTAIGLPFVHWGKHILKPARAKACLRPWHEDYDHHQRSSGGFPSGHMANVTYMTTLWGIRHGPRWAIPLGLFASFVFVDFVNCNRHYVSQLIAGAGVGALYACAAAKVIDRREGGNISMSMCGSIDGSTTMRCQYVF